MIGWGNGRILYHALDITFFAFHSCLILFNLFGWIWKKTRMANLVVILLTLGSWFILGIWFGTGYCPSTDWHWQVREKLGYQELPPSYTAFLFREITGWEPGEGVINWLTLILLLTALLASLFTNCRDLRRKARAKKNP